MIFFMFRLLFRERAAACFTLSATTRTRAVRVEDFPLLIPHHIAMSLRGGEVGYPYTEKDQGRSQQETG